MKDIKEILNLPVVSIQDGVEIAVVKSLVINCEKKAIEYLIIEKKDNRQIQEAIPYSEVIGVGSYALTVDSSLSVISFEPLKLDEKQFKKHDDIVSQKIITQTGDYIGVVLGFDFDDNTGQINSITYKDNSTQSKRVEKQDLVTIGYKLLIIRNAISILTKQSDKIVSKNISYNNFKKQDKNILENKVKEEVNQTNDVDNFIMDITSSAIGKILKEDILDYEGNIILYKGIEIKQGDIQKVNSIDENLVYEVLANI